MLPLMAGAAASTHEKAGLSGSAAAGDAAGANLSNGPRRSGSVAQPRSSGSRSLDAEQLMTKIEAGLGR